MKTFISAAVLILLNITLYNITHFFSTNAAFQVIVVNLAFVFVVILFASSDFVKKRELLRLNKQLNKIRLRIEDEQREIQILHSLNAISESFVHDTNIGVIFEQTLLAIRRILNADIAVLFLYDDKTKMITHRIYGGSEQFDVDRPVLERVIEKGTSVLINRLSPEHTEYVKYKTLYNQGFKSTMIAPVKIKDRTIGLLGIFTQSNVDYTGEELRVLTTFSTHVSIIIENGQLLETTQKLAITDEMTQLFNYRYFQQRLNEEFHRAQRYVHSLSLVILDIDYFKNYNDTNGHPMGDMVIQRVASLLKDSIRPTDFAARYGGEEFVVILAETDKKGSELFADKFRKIVENTPFKNEKNQPNKKLTISLGASNFPSDASTPAELINMADKALYLAKQAGRNTVKVYNDKS